MSEKNRDNYNRWRCKTIAFRVSPEENELLEKQVRLSAWPVFYFMQARS